MEASRFVLYVSTLSCFLQKTSKATSGSVQMCDVVNDIELERERCENKTAGNVTSGCKGMWDIIACWPSAKVGEMVVIPCPNYFSYFSDHYNEGNLSKTCTADGWTEVHPITIAVNCGYNLNGTGDDHLTARHLSSSVCHLLLFGCLSLSQHTQQYDTSIIPPLYSALDIKTFPQ